MSLIMNYHTTAPPRKRTHEASFFVNQPIVPVVLDTDALGPHTFCPRHVARNGTSYEARIVHYVPACDAWVTQALGTGDISLLPASMITGITARKLNNIHPDLKPTENTGRACWYRLRDGNWARAEVVRDFDNHQVLLRIPEYDAAHWWYGYTEQCVVDGENFRWDQ
jgi:hypothetical protein